ncbi:MAG TPA: tetratricopeptide repeat protein [Chthoniobacterales bacterium]|nr:tetratricopeptide repeat protein [Chthoniobacterales bacterium]
MAKKNKARRAAQRWEKSIKVASAPREPRSLGTELWWLLPALVLGFLIYANTLNGEFVYDDLRQIVRNTLIQDGSQFWRALTSDVWAFKGGDQAASNYWRPSYVLWMIINFRCFGLAPFGWHLTNILLHVGVVALLFALLRRLDVSRPIAGGIALIFAVHPVHTESVAWISGTPDLILAAALLGSIWFVLLLSEKATPFRWAAAIGLYAVALGAKEVAILFPLVVLVLPRGGREQGEKEIPWSPAISIAWPFAALALVYLVIRQLILGTAQQLPEGGASLGETILSVPAVFAFYLRQMIAPYWIGPSYPLRAVTSLGLLNFVVPLVVSAVAGWWMVRMAGRTRIARIGLALLLVPLLPAMYIAAFHPEQLVHDRYLYLPLLGFLMLVIPVLASLLERVAGEAAKRGPMLIFVFAVVVAVPLGAQTLRYNQAWTANLALWEWGVRSDPNSAFNYQQYGVKLQEAKKLADSVAAFDKSIAIRPMDATIVSRATTLIDLQRFAEAERDLRGVTAKQTAEVNAYTMYQAYERLAVSLSQQNKLDEAAAAIGEARRRLPQYIAALTEKLAVILYQGGRKNDALNELNAVRAQGHSETLPESRLIFYRMGLLNQELGHPQEARAAFQEFLSVTRGILTPEIEQARSQSEAALRSSGR